MVTIPSILPTHLRQRVVNAAVAPSPVWVVSTHLYHVLPVQQDTSLWLKHRSAFRSALIPTMYRDRTASNVMPTVTCAI